MVRSCRVEFRAFPFGGLRGGFMILHILFWLMVALDAGAILLIGVLGLAAAAPSHTNPLHALAVTVVLPGSVLLAAIAVYLKSSSQGMRILALLLVAFPFLFMVIGSAASFIRVAGYMDSGGKPSNFRKGPLREMEAAIERNDADTVTRLARGAALDTEGISGATLLVLAVRQLDKTPDQLEVLRALLKAGANPNAGRDEIALSAAIAATRKSGLEPVRLLLEAGANPNLKGRYTDPAYFMAGATAIDPVVMTMMIERGADLKLRDSQGNSPVHDAVLTGNWKVALLLVEKGVDWSKDRGPSNVPLLAYLESIVHTSNGNKDLAALIERMKSKGQGATP